MPSNDDDYQSDSSSIDEPLAKVKKIHSSTPLSLGQSHFMDVVQEVISGNVSANNSHEISDELLEADWPEDAKLAVSSFLVACPHSKKCRLLIISVWHSPEAYQKTSKAARIMGKKSEENAACYWSKVY